MIGIPATLPVGVTRLNNAGRSNDTSSNFTNALNYGELAAGNIVRPDAGVLTSADAFANSSNQNSDDRPIKSATGQWVSSKSGSPWHGQYRNPNGTTQYYSNGLQVSDVGQVGLEMPNIGVQKIAKDPALSSQVTGAIDANGKAAPLLGKSFNDYLTEAQAATKSLGDSTKAAQSAIDPSGTISRVNSDVNTVGNQLNSTLNNYGIQQGAVQADIAGNNQNYQSNQSAALAALKAKLDSQNADYARAAQAVAGQAFASAGRANNLYHLQSSTPTSGSGQLDSRLINAFDSINVPLQRELADRNLATTNQVYNLGSNLEGQYYNNFDRQFQGQGALNTDLTNRANSNAQYFAGTDQDAAKYIQSLQTQIATMHPQLALQYLNSLGIPIATAQQIIAGNTSNLQGLSTLDQGANNFNFLTPYQPNFPGAPVPAINFPPSGNRTATGGYNNFGASAPSSVFRATPAPAGYYNPSADQLNSEYYNTPAGAAAAAAPQSPYLSAGGSDPYRALLNNFGGAS